MKTSPKNSSQSLELLVTCVCVCVEREEERKSEFRLSSFVISSTKTQEASVFPHESAEWSQIIRMNPINYCSLFKNYIPTHSAQCHWNNFSPFPVTFEVEVSPVLHTNRLRQMTKNPKGLTDRHQILFLSTPSSRAKPVACYACADPRRSERVKEISVKPPNKTLVWWYHMFLVKTIWNFVVSSWVVVVKLFLFMQMQIMS